MLIGGASVIDHARRMRGKGVAGDVHIDWPDLMAFKRSFTDPVPQKQEDSYTAKGIATFHGEARFAGPNSVEIAGQALNARYILIATGAAPVRLGIPGEEHVLDNAGPRISAICFEGKLSLSREWISRFA